MLKKEKFLNEKELVGKRIRTRALPNAFYIIMLLLSVYFFVSFPLLSQSAEERKAMLEISCIVGLPILLITLLIFLFDRLTRKLLCVFSDDKLYFFNQPLIEVNPSTQKKKATTCSGSLDYDDILKMQYVPAVKRWIGLTRQTTVSHQSVILQGVDFQVSFLYGDRDIINKIKKRQKHSVEEQDLQRIPCFDTLEHERHGLWKHIWNTLKTNKGENIFNNDIRVTYFNNDEKSNAITLIVVKSNLEFTFNMDEETVFMSADDERPQKSVSYSNISNINDLYEKMRRFIDP